MVAIQPVETSGTIDTNRHIPENMNLNQHRCENLKCCITKMLCTYVVLPEIKNRLGGEKRLKNKKN